MQNIDGKELKGIDGREQTIYEDTECDEGFGNVNKPSSLEYGVEDNPPVGLTIILGLQAVLTTIAGTIGAGFIIFSMVCADGNNLVLSQLMSTSVFMTGVSTLLQVTIGVRLPIYQGSSYIYFVPLMNMLQSEQWQCPKQINGTIADFGINTSEILNPLENFDEPWKPRLAAISGSLAVASIFHILVGATGLVGFLMRFIGPLTVTPVVGLIGIMLYDVINLNARYQWGITFGTVALILIFSVFMKDITIPLCSFGKAKRKRIPVFKLFSNALATGIMWIVCIILTKAGAFPSDPNHLSYNARSDARIEVLWTSSWIHIPYPGQWGPITIDTVAALSILGCVLLTVLESIGDYHATSRVCEVADPPKHAINRGIMMEGICSVFSGLCGAAHATTSYSNVMGFIVYTGNASRVTWIVASVMLMVFGIFGKFGAVLATIPQPIIGGLTLVGLGMCFSIAISNLELIDIKSARNQMILALSFAVGVSLPMCYKDYPESLQTGIEAFDIIVGLICTNPFLLGGLIGFVLDNILPGTRKERGMADLDKAPVDDLETQNIHRPSYSVYHSRVSTYLSKFRIVRFIPFMPDKEDIERETRHPVVDLSNQTNM